MIDIAVRPVDGRSWASGSNHPRTTPQRATRAYGAAAGMIPAHDPAGVTA
jgi:hypothetical protein